MKDALPPYIVKCFTTAGFDTMQVILKMDVSDEPGNSIEQIEQFISDEHPDLLTSKSKKPPGHRIRIQQFVSELCAKKQSLGKIGHSGHKNKASKRTRLSDTSDTSDNTSDFKDSDQVSIIGIIRHCHWATLAIEDNDINLYDSAYSSISKETMKTIANLAQCKNDSFTVNLMNIKNQTGIADCALYAMAVATCLILKDDPTTVVFHQDELRTHVCQCLEKGTITLFPMKKKRRHVSRVCRTETLSVYCYCRMPDHGQLMVHCSQCDDWFHRCLQKIPDDDIDFICNICSSYNYINYQ